MADVKKILLYWRSCGVGAIGDYEVGESAIAIALPSPLYRTQPAPPFIG
ncbi:hypothetical protein [Argonema galeatum]|nr:hypothetical protein [Argonema galeatum]MCL1468516.1 hypothetical protein [Argonema galeatum A003/A1]